MTQNFEGSAVSFVKGNMVIDPALQQEIVSRAIAGNFGDEPEDAASPLGEILLPDGRTVQAYVRHAAEVGVVDGHGHIVLITRKHNPGAGRLGLVGGFMDVITAHDGTETVETVEAAALREAAEETGISTEVLNNATVTALGERHYRRPFDIRQAYSDFLDTGIKAGDLFLVSTRTVCIRVAGNLRQTPLLAGDDAGDVRIANIAELAPDQFGVPDHYAAIQTVRKFMA